jgi:serine/threonine-protein kinase
MRVPCRNSGTRLRGTSVAALVRVSRIPTVPLVAESEVGWATPPGGPREPEARVGQLLGSYRVLDVVGSGGMGCVYRAEHIRLGRLVALKVLHEQHARRRDAALRLFQEARAASQIRHRNIVDVIDWLELDGGTVCIVMEYLRGPSLAELVGAPARLPVTRALDLAAQIAEALDAAHAAGIIHRDLKPDNVVVLPGDHVKLLDFGVAKLTEDRGDETPLTAAGQVLGTPAYMSPEQATGGEVDARTDIYSLGAILYESLTGQLPFEGHSFDEFAFKHLAVSPPPPSATPGGRGLDPRIDALVMRCLEKRPADRVATAFELRAELLALRASLARRPRRKLRAALAVAAAALVGFAAAHAGRSQPHASPPPAQAAAPAGPPMVRIVSDPPAHVYPGGRDQPLCSTPCAIAVPPRSARPVYMVKRRGYLDAAISVDAAAPPSQVRIRLERARGTRP